MALQNTTASAFLSTSPVEDANTGRILQEHIAFWAQFDSDEEAKRKAEKARQAEFNRKKNKDAFDLYDGLAGQEATGYFQNQVRKYIDVNSDRLLDISQRASAGDENAILQYNHEKQKLQGMISGSVAVADKIKELQALKDAGKFNELRDGELFKTISSLQKSNYIITPEGQFKIWDGSASEFVDVDPLGLGFDLSKATYHAPVNFDDIGDDIAGSIKLKKVDGETRITPENIIDAKARIRNEFKDANVLTTWALSQNMKRELTDLDVDKLVDKFYETQVKSGLQVISTPIAIKTKKQALVNAQLEARKKRKALDDAKPVFTRADDEKEVPITSITVDGKTIKGDVINVEGFFVEEAIGEKTFRQTVNQFVRDKKTGDISAVVTTKETVPAVFDPETDFETSPATTKSTTRVVTDKNELNLLVKEMNEINSLSEVSKEIDIAIGKIEEPPSDKPPRATDEDIKNLPDLKN